MDQVTRKGIESLGERAQLALRLIRQKRRPLFIEFAGTPKSGKTVSLNHLSLFLKRNGFVVRVFQERASVAPLVSKGTPAFNAWVTGATLLGMLEALEDDKLDVFILDRGLFDGLVWNDWLARTHRIGAREAEIFRKYVLTRRWWDLIDILFVLHCDPVTALEREYADQITMVSGSIMNEKTLAQLRANVLTALRTYQDQLREVVTIDTSQLTAREGTMGVATQALEALEKFLDEEVLCIPVSEFRTWSVVAGSLLTPGSWDSVRATIDVHGEYKARSVAEDTDDLTQIIPVAVIRHGDTYLTNIRYEPDESLHETLANWAGGHVRRQDLDRVSSKWESVVAALRREIEEELLLTELPDPRVLGLVHTAEDARAARHVGVVFEILLDDPETAAALHQKTIRERPNRWVRTSWMSVAELRASGDRQKEWSSAIGEFLAQRA